MVMEKEEKQNGVEQKKSSPPSPSPSSLSKVLDPEFKLQWGKRMKCNRRKLTSRIVSHASSADPPFSLPSRLNRVAEGLRNGKSPSPEKEERYYSTRGSTVGEEKENGRSSVEGNGVGIGIDIGREDKGNLVWPKLYITLSSKEKEEDFLAMKGCKLPQRPKKRSKLIQRTLLLVSPGAWLTDLCQERYEVREKKTPKKKPRGLKAMGNIVDTDSE